MSTPAAPLAPPVRPGATRADAGLTDTRLIAIGGLVTLAGVLLWRRPALDLVLFRLINDLGPTAPTLWSMLSVAGLGLSAWIWLVACAEQTPRRPAQLLWVLVVGGLVTHFIKHGVDEARPLAVLGEGHLTVIGEALRLHSMPSGHSAMAGALWALLHAERRRHDEHAAVAAGWASDAGLAAAGLLSVGIALSRVAVGAHWPADLLVGGGLGLVFGSLAPRAWPVAALARGLASRPGRALLAIVLLACAVSIGATPGLLQACGVAGTHFARQVDVGYPLAAPLQLLLALLALAGAWRWGRAARRPAR